MPDIIVETTLPLKISIQNVCHSAFKGLTISIQREISQKNNADALMHANVKKNNKSSQSFFQKSLIR